MACEEGVRLEVFSKGENGKSLLGDRSERRRQMRGREAAGGHVCLPTEDG